MGLDLKNDAQRIRLVALVNAAFFLAVLGLVSYRSLNLSWQEWQGLFFENRDSSDPQPLRIVQQKLCSGDEERCTTCHLGMIHAHTAQPETPKVFRTHPMASFANSHIIRGCSPCHGGTLRALDESNAHALEGQQTKDPLMHKPHIQASCARCHTPGDQPGQERLVHGALLYLRLGCNICHPLTDDGLGGFDFGPDLKTMGRKNLSFLEASLINPTANFPQSTMPSFQSTFENHPESLVDLIIFLESLSLDPLPRDCTYRGKQSIGSHSNCTDCHGGVGGKAYGRVRHRCVYILNRSEELSCKRCHSGPLPESSHTDGVCPLVDQHTSNCQVCHHDNP